METIREMSLNVIEAVEAWREQSQVGNQEDSYGNNVIKKISTDIDFIRSSPLRKYM